MPFRKCGALVLGVTLASGEGCARDVAEDAREASASLDYKAVLPGVGYDQMDDSVADFCVDFDGSTSVPGASGQSVTFSLERIESSSALSRKLNVSAAASAKFAIMGGDAKTQFVEEHEMNETSLYLLASVQVVNAPSILVHPRLKADASDTLRTSAEAFRRRCGDGFVNAVITGGEFYGVIEIQTASEEDKQAVSASLDVSGPTWSASAEFSKAVTSAVANKSVRIWTSQRGGTERKNNALFGNTGGDQFIGDAFFRAVVLNPELAALNVNMEQRAVNAVAVFPAGFNQKIMVLPPVKHKFTGGNAVIS